MQDPVLRKWLIGRATGRWQALDFHRLHPPYLETSELGQAVGSPLDFSELISTPPTEPLHIILAGEKVTVKPGEEHHLITRPFADTESLLALHRFAWIDKLGDKCDPKWVSAIWSAWVENHGAPDPESWAWHPYTVAERLINILTFAEQVGLPGHSDETLEILYLHGPAIWQKLEYFGEINTGNHLANSGRGLFLGGLKLNINQWIKCGEKILIREAERLFLPSGVLREGSSHYHLLITRWYAECWLAALKSKRPSADKLGKIVTRALSIMPIFDMPNGMPLIGDISPDCSPEFLIGLITGEKIGWLSMLSDMDIAALEMARPQTLNKNSLAAKDGWHKKQIGKWQSLWHIAPTGWSEQPGHSHQDFGSFELYYDDTPVFVDRGRRSYGEIGNIDILAEAHNSLRINNQDAYPANKPYYSDPFRLSVCGKNPQTYETDNTFTIETASFSRIKNVGTWKRKITFNKTEIIVTDYIDGRGQHRIERNLHTTLTVTLQDKVIDIGNYELRADDKANLTASNIWPTYGQKASATALSFTSSVNLPWTGRLILKIKS